MRTSNPNYYYDSARHDQKIFGFLRSIFQLRELLALLVSGELSSRYRRSFIGLLWTLINPIISSLVLWVVFVSIFKSRLNNGTQFAPYLLAGILTINFFNQGLLQGAESISSGPKLFLKTRIDPRIFCVSSVLSNGVNFFFGVLALALISLLSGARISLLFPLTFLVGLALTLLSIGLGLIFAVLFIRFDDIKYILTILLQLLTYLTPVFYPKEVLGANMQTLVSLNPLTSYLEVFRNVFNGTEIATRFDWIYMFGSSIFIFILGTLFFRKFWIKTVVML